MQGAAGIVSKGDFARLAGVSAARVSQYISQGQIGPEAMVGEGRAARIRVDVAMRHLRDRLDVGQRLANGLGTRIEVPAGQGELPSAAAKVDSPPVIASAATAPLSREPSVEDQLKAEKLWRAQADRRRIEREERAGRGLYTRTEDAGKAMKKLAGDLLAGFEGGLDGMARAIAARFELPQRDVLHLMRTEFRGVRARLAAAQQAGAAGLAETIEDPVDEVDASDAESAAATPFGDPT